MLTSDVGEQRLPNTSPANQRVMDVVRSVLPAGTAPIPGQAPDWATFPTHPADAFAVAATLLERSGCYQCIPPHASGLASPGPGCSDPFELLGERQLDLRIRGMAWAYGYPFLPASDDPEEQQQANKLKDQAIEHFSQRFRDYATPEDLAQAAVRLPQVTGDGFRELWLRLSTCTDPVREDMEPSPGDFPNWWTDAIHLFILADEAAVGLGFFQRHGVTATYWQRRLLPETGTPEERKPLRTLTEAADPDIVCVLPKTRTPSVGCTLRSLSHNLSLAPARGRVEVEWYPVLRSDSGSAEKAFNILIVPFPSFISTKCFSAHGGFFNMSQDWLVDAAKLQDLVPHLIEAAHVTIHAVVFPEYALDWKNFVRLRDRLAEDFPDVSMFMAGVSESRQDQKKGNHVATWVRQLDESYSRPKHHRWRIDERQLARYGMPSIFGRGRGWWENIPLDRRVVQFFPLRHGSVFTPLICEDLARIEPCQAVIRAVGPNLVFVLLMDGAQIAERWPNQYAGVLADDPGSSVLTITSLGLINRIRSSDLAGRRAVALWRQAGDLQSIELRESEIAVVVMLESEEIEEFSLDGRSDAKAATSWKLAGTIPIRRQPGQGWL